MEVKHGKRMNCAGGGVEIHLSGDDVALAIDAYLVAHGFHVSGPRTVTVNGCLCRSGRVYVDPSGFVVAGGEKYDGLAQAERQGEDASDG